MFHFICSLQEWFKVRMQGKYGDDISTHPELEEDAYRFTVGGGE